MELILVLLTIQGIMGAFDLVYHHEITEKLTWKPGAAEEMWLHGIRNGLYAVVFFSLGFYHWHGVLAWIFLAILLVEVTITLWDFVIEDQTRKLPATERVTHTLLALNYGAVLGLFIPEFITWINSPTQFSPVYYGFLSWVMALYATGVFIWFFRDFLRSFRLRRMAATHKEIPLAKELAGKRILVTGGTGFIGKALCESLIQSGCKITVLTRSIKRAAESFNIRVEFIESLQHLDTNEHFDVVINLAGEPIAQRWTEEAKRRILGSRLNTTRELLAFFERAQNKPELFISGSAIGWYGVHDSSIFDENSQPSKETVGVFAKEVCHEWEAEALKAKAYNIRTVVLRTGIVLEKDGGTLAELLFPFDFGFGGPIGNGKQWFSWIHRDDLIGLILYALRNDAVEGVINGTAPTPVTNKEFSFALGKAMKRPSLIPLPPFVLKMVFGQMAEEIMLNGQKVVPSRTVQYGYAFQHPNINSAFKAIFRV